MHISHLAEEIDLRSKLVKAQLDLVDFYVKYHHISRKNAVVKAGIMPKCLVEQAEKLLILEKDLVKTNNLK